jgi:gliding motility-associated protein GldM
MAGGKQSPRQKMINMMYLVLTALLALNISKDILKALTKLDDSLVQTVNTVEQKNAQVYAAFDAAMADNPAKTKEWRDKAYDVKKKSDALVEDIIKIKDDIVMASGGYEEDELGKKVPLKLDSKEPPANYLLNEGHGKELREKIESYKNTVLSVTDNPALQGAINARFNTEPVIIEKGSTPVEWEKANFEHYPLAAILPFLTNIEADIRNTESDVIGALQTNISAADIKVTGVRAVIDAKSSYVVQGSNYEAEVFLAAFDDTQEPIIEVNGEELPADQIAGGIGKVSFPTSSVGEMTWGGVIKLKQIGADDKVIPFEGSYTVAPPTVVISPTKMNVLYRGVQNPLEIGVPGVDPSKLRVSGPGISGSNGQYMANVTNVKGKDVSISVSVEETDEEGNTTVKNMGSKPFRIKGLPPAQGLIFKRAGGKFAKNLVSSATIEAAYQDFPFDLPLTVSSFEVAIPGFPPEKVQGNKMTATIAQRLATLKPNSTIVVRDIQARGPGGLRVTKISAIPIDVN